MASAWPGNVRELENVISRGALRAAGRVQPGEMVLIDSRDLDVAGGRAVPATGETPLGSAGPELSLREAVEEYQRLLIRRAVERHAGNWSAAARALGVERANLHHLGKRLGLK
jgi:anaerobic nitric oxide reductase transcription regulator